MNSLRRLSPYLKPYFWHIFGAVLLALPLAALRTLPAWFTQRLVDDLFISKNGDLLWKFTLGFLGLYVLNFPIRFFHYYLLRIVVIRVNQKLKNDLFHHVQNLSTDYFTAQSVGSLISRVGSDPQLVDSGIASLNVIIREPLNFIFLFCYAMYLDWRLTIITLIILPPLAFVFSAAGRNLKRYIQRLADENAQLFSVLQEAFSGARVIKLFRLEDRMDARFKKRGEAYAYAHFKIAKLEEATHPLVELVTAFAIAGVIYYGGMKIVHGVMKPGELIGFFAAFALMLNPLRTMNDVNLKLHTAASACSRIFEVFAWKSRLDEKPNAQKISEFRNAITLNQVEFAYPDSPDRRILKKISLEVRQGEAVALVGPSGAGKSSIAGLLPRLYDVTGGKILIDGHDVRDLKLADLRRLISTVSQDVFLFNDTIASNIRCGKENASDQEVIDAARRAHALEFIENLPDGMNSNVGDRGQKLSGGEKQRISIARAFLRESPILILDEATSSLDNRSERAVQEALEELMINRTTLVIAHRLSTIRNCNRILVVREGEIVETGNYDALMTQKGEFYRLQTLSMN